MNNESNVIILHLTWWLVLGCVFFSLYLINRINWSVRCGPRLVFTSLCAEF